MTEAQSEPPKIIPAATVVIFRNCPAGGPPELLMVQRAKEMRFAGGAAVLTKCSLPAGSRRWWPV